MIRKTMRVPVRPTESGDGTAMARRLDAALLSAGFTLSKELLEHLSKRDPQAVATLAVKVLAAVRELVGDHVAHNVYFMDFPANVPDTMTFWTGLAGKAIAHPDGAPKVAERGLNLLDLPGYGRYQHSYEEMAEAHDRFLELATDRVTVLRLGATLDEEAAALYLALAGSSVPLSAADLAGLGELAKAFVDGPQPASYPVRENKAVVNTARLVAGLPMFADTPTDVLRAACGLSGGDVTLLEPTRFGPIGRALRKALLSTLDGLVAADETLLTDVGRRPERWKRLGERLHPHEYPRWPMAAEVFAVARGDRNVRTFAAKVEVALSTGDTTAALSLLRTAPGTLMRSVDRLARLDTPGLLDAVADAAPHASARVLLSLREHLGRRDRHGGPRIFVNRASGAWVRSDPLPPLDSGLVAGLREVLDTEIAGRLPDPGTILYDPAVLDVALPLSQKGNAEGFGVLPRGSKTAVGGELLRFFMYWRNSERMDTDYDLSAQLLDDEFRQAGWLSYTELEGFGGVHSGDIVTAPEGASEFIDLELAKVTARYIVPQVNIYDGEGFAWIAESVFGYMERSREQKGMPFEARTVRTKSAVRGAGRVALPLLFERGEDGEWSARWLHLFLKGNPFFNTVEGNLGTASLMARGILAREYLTVGYLLDLWRALGTEVREWDGTPPGGKVTWIGLDVPDGLPAGTDALSPERFGELIPA